MLWKSASSALEASDADVMASMPEMGNAGKRQLGVEQGLVGWSDLLGGVGAFSRKDQNMTVRAAALWAGALLLAL